MLCKKFIYEWMMVTAAVLALIRLSCTFAMVVFEALIDRGLVFKVVQ